MSMDHPNSDADLMDLVRVTGPLTVTEIAHAMEVTATAIRQRLTRLMGQSLISREAVRAGRGRPKYLYSLTDNGLRQTGSNLSDLAVALWREFQVVEDEDLRRDMLRRIAQALATGYASEIQGDTVTERLRSLGELLNKRRIPVSVETAPAQATLTAHACPYPNLADEDRSVCTMEKMLFSELVGKSVQLTQCRLDGGGDCRFQTG